MLASDKGKETNYIDTVVVGVLYRSSLSQLLLFDRFIECLVWCIYRSSLSCLDLWLGVSDCLVKRNFMLKPDI